MRKKRYSKTTYVILLVSIITALMIVGCAYKFGKDQEKSQKEIKAYVHKTHDKVGTSNCETCHTTAYKSSLAGMPSEKICIFCHEKVGKGVLVQGLYNKDKWTADYKIARAKFDEIKISHKEHMDVKEISCKDCHGNIANSIEVTDEHVPTMESCFQCHKKWVGPKQCEKCHKEIAADTLPKSHFVNDFKNNHGKIVKEKYADPAKRLTSASSCFICHSQDSCDSCHQAMPPENHNNQWRLIGHGITAGIERERCSTCHKTDFCSRCHENVKPRSHLENGWGEPTLNHCNSCHMPISSTSCGVCHKTTPSHEKKPADHIPLSWGVPANNHCMTCHRTPAKCLVCHEENSTHNIDSYLESHIRILNWGSPANKHCAACHTNPRPCMVCHHEGTPSHDEVEPITHTARYGSPRHQHCLQCHMPISNSPQCSTCHPARVGEHISEAVPIPDDFRHRPEAIIRCRRCHISGIRRLRHADNGQACKICHER